LRFACRLEIRSAALPAEIRSLAAFDRKVFPSDHFSTYQWRTYESYWLLLSKRKIGCCAFEPHVDFRDDLRDDGINPHRQGSLYIASTGILPKFQSMGFGQLLKAWQISYARLHGFTRIVTNTRKRNAAMIALNKKFGFKIVRTTPRYYRDPPDATVVMELSLQRAQD
jgi:ribosomal protein S18 acetylase RimI-like enzyme